MQDKVNVLLLMFKCHSHWEAENLVLVTAQNLSALQGSWKPENEHFLEAIFCGSFQCGWFSGEENYHIATCLAWGGLEIQRDLD